MISSMEKIYLISQFKNDLKTYDNIIKTANSQGNDCTTWRLPDHSYFKNYYKIISIDLSKQQKIDANPKEIQQIHFTGNQDTAESETMFLIIEEEKKTVSNFSKGTITIL